MKKELFIEQVKRRGVTIKLSEDPFFNKESIEDFGVLKSLFKSIDFDCRVDKNGGCKKALDSTGCCCSECFSNTGYFRYLVDFDLTYYARNFQSKIGFWRKNKGCVLPHKRRSTTCITHHCNHMMDKDFSKGMFVLQEFIRQLRDKI